MDRDAIERHDFPVSRRGYDQAAVAAHLRRVADAVEELRARTAAPSAARGLAAGASDRVREILEAAERSAAGLRDQAGRDAAAHVARVAEAAAAMLSRLDQLQREVDAVLEGLRRSGAQLEQGLARLREDVGAPDHAAAAIEEDHAAAAPSVVDPPEPEAVPEPPVVAQPPAAAPDEAGARLIALNMALGGTPREETARYLAEHYELPDSERLLDDVYSRADPRSAT